MVVVPALFQVLLIAVIALSGSIVMKTDLNMSVERIGFKNDFKRFSLSCFFLDFC